jgi:hypothetical protein
MPDHFASISQAGSIVRAHWKKIELLKMGIRRNVFAPSNASEVPTRSSGGPP